MNELDISETILQSLNYHSVNESQNGMKQSDEIGRAIVSMTSEREADLWVLLINYLND